MALLITFLLSTALAVTVSAEIMYSPSTCALFTRWAYSCEEHIVGTRDGWQLKMHHVPARGSQRRGAVLYQHGLTDSSAGVSLNQPKQALPFILADEGWDVWMGNSRGNGQSMTNIYFQPSSERFWDWTFSEMALYDVPANINYVLNKTGHETLIYIGHSQVYARHFLLARLVSPRAHNHRAQCRASSRLWIPKLPRRSTCLWQWHR